MPNKSRQQQKTNEMPKKILDMIDDDNGGTQIHSDFCGEQVYEHCKSCNKPVYCEPVRVHQKQHGHIVIFYQIHTHTHPFNGTFSGTTRLSRYQKGKTNLDFTGARDS